jgi:hypothetical protein
MGATMTNLEEVGFLKNTDVDQLIKSVTSPGGMTALTTAAVPEIGVAGAANYVAARAELIDWCRTVASLCPSELS